MEHHPTFLTTLLIAGLRYPVRPDMIVADHTNLAEPVVQVLSAGMGLGWSVARVIYALGYVGSDKPNGNGRIMGNWFWFSELGLQFAAGLTGYKMITG